MTLPLRAVALQTLAELPLGRRYSFVATLVPLANNTSPAFFMRGSQCATGSPFLLVYISCCSLGSGNGWTKHTTTLLSQFHQIDLNYNTPLQELENYFHCTSCLWRSSQSADSGFGGSIPGLILEFPLLPPTPRTHTKSELGRGLRDGESPHWALLGAEVSWQHSCWWREPVLGPPQSAASTGGLQWCWYRPSVGLGGLMDKMQ